MIPLNLPERIETERLLLQRLRYEDAEEMFYCYASKTEATKFMSWPTHKDTFDTRAFLRYAVAAWQEGMEYSFSIRLKDAGRMIGGFGVINENGKVQFGYILTPTFWGKGYATEACCTMMALLKKEKDVYRIGTYVDLENIASIKVLEKSGLVEEVRLRRWMRFPNQNNAPKDCALYSLPLGKSRGFEVQS